MTGLRALHLSLEEIDARGAGSEPKPRDEKGQGSSAIWPRQALRHELAPLRTKPWPGPCLEGIMGTRLQTFEEPSGFRIREQEAECAGSPGPLAMVPTSAEGE